LSKKVPLNPTTLPSREPHISTKNVASILLRHKLNTSACWIVAVFWNRKVTKSRT
jgi:hypothetical protein